MARTRPRRGPEGSGAAGAVVPEPASRAGHPARRSWPSSSSTPAMRCRSSTRWCAPSPWTRCRSPPPRRRSGTPGPRTTRQPQRGRIRAAGARAREARAAPGDTSSLARSWPGPSRRWPPIPRCGQPPWIKPIEGELRRARAPPVHRASAGPAPGTPLQKPLTRPPAHRERRNTRPCPRHLHLAPRLLNRAPARTPARLAAPGTGLDARYGTLHHAALHARAECVPPRTVACSPARA